MNNVNVQKFYSYVVFLSLLSLSPFFVFPISFLFLVLFHYKMKIILYPYIFPLFPHVLFFFLFPIFLSLSLFFFFLVVLSTKLSERDGVLFFFWQGDICLMAIHHSTFFDPIPVFWFELMMLSVFLVNSCELPLIFDPISVIWISQAFQDFHINCILWSPHFLDSSFSFLFLIIFLLFFSFFFFCHVNRTVSS